MIRAALFLVMALVYVLEAVIDLLMHALAATPTRGPVR